MDAVMVLGLVAIAGAAIWVKNNFTLTRKPKPLPPVQEAVLDLPPSEYSELPDELGD